MTPQPLSRSQLKRYRSLKQGKFRRQERLFLLEGIRLCEDVIRTGFPLEACILGLGFEADWIPSGVPILQATSTQLEQLADSRSPQEIICIGRIPDALPPELGAPIGLLLDRIADPGNLGTILRTARWFGVDDILLTPGCADPWSPKAVRSSMGAVATARIRFLDDEKGFQEAWTKAGRQVLALEMAGTPLAEVQVQGPILLLVGSEAHGLAPGLLEGAQAVTIPGQGSAESLNAAIATGIALWELVGKG